jgi:hypothetical protein
MKEVKIKKSMTNKKIRRNKLIYSSSSKSLDLGLNLKENHEKILCKEKPSNCIKGTNYVKVNINNSKNNDKIITTNVISNGINKFDKIKMIKKENEIKKNLKNNVLHRNNYNLEQMKKSPPKVPDIFYHIYFFNNEKALTKENEIFGTLNRENVPNIFYNHLFYNINKPSYTCRLKNKKISLTQRNKKKLLTIIYYSP